MAEDVTRDVTPASARDVFAVEVYDTAPNVRRSLVWNLLRAFVMQDTNPIPDLPRHGVRIVVRSSGRAVFDDPRCSKVTETAIVESLDETTASEFAAMWDVRNWDDAEPAPG